MLVTSAHKGRPVASFSDLLSFYSTREFSSPTRSTVPFLAYWRDSTTRVSEFASAIGISFAGHVDLDFEHEVPVQRGSGFPSCTDVMIFNAEAVAAVEAKFAEPRYPSVGAWLVSPAKMNRLEVLSGWLTLLSAAGRCHLSLDDVLALPYQLIHRAASACHRGDREPWLVYQVFDASPKKLGMYSEDLRRLANALGTARRLKIRLVACQMTKSASYMNLESDWALGHRDLSVPVKSGLLAATLLDVHIRSVVSI
jgi:hypothetical protein